jgi:hypothetical protein
MVARGKIDNSKTYIHDCLLFWLSTGTSIKNDGVTLIIWTQTSPLDVTF